MLWWFARKLKEAQEKDNEKGFTLIELLVVVIIIGILAAIAIPVLLQQRTRAQTATCESDARNGASAATGFAADNNGSYAGMTLATLQTTYDWNVSAESGTPTLTGPGMAGSPSATGYGISITCSSGSTVTFDSATGQVTSS